MLRINNFVPEIILTTAQQATDPAAGLRTTARILDSLGAKWFLAFGSALGFYRDKDFIKGDTDIDIAVIGEEPRVIDKLSARYDYIRELSYNGNLMQTAFQGKDRFIIDICYFYEDKENYYSFCEGGKWVDKKKNIGRPKLLKTEYGLFPFPEMIEDYLQDRYGNWKIPKHGAITSSIKV